MCYFFKLQTPELKAPDVPTSNKQGGFELGQELLTLHTAATAAAAASEWGWLTRRALWSITQETH